MEAAWKQLTDDKDATNWILLGFPKKTLDVVGSGSGGLSELVGKFDDAEVMFAAFKVLGVDDKAAVTSSRSKYIGVTFVGGNVSGMKKSRTLSSKEEINMLFQGCAASMQISAADELTAIEVARKLLASGGAHKPVHYDFGGDETINLSEMDNYASGSTPAKKPAPKPKVVAKPAKPAKKPGKTEHDKRRNKFFVENYSAEEVKEPIVIESTFKDSVYIGKCTGGVYKIDGKCKNLTINGCSGIGVLANTVVVGVELINCKKVDFQTTGTIPFIQIDNCERIKVYLSPEAVAGDVKIFSSKTSAVNVYNPTEDGDMKENDLPEQIVSEFVDGKFVSSIKVEG